MTVERSTTGRAPAAHGPIMIMLERLVSDTISSVTGESCPPQGVDLVSTSHSAAAFRIRIDHVLPGLAAAREFVRALERKPGVASVRLAGSNCHVAPTFDAAHDALLGGRQIAVSRPAPATAGPVEVNFCCPNLNKPLHVGHLRNAVLGMSLSRLLEYRGYAVTRSAALSDWGLHIAHAAAGFESTLPDQVPSTASPKLDHLVGAWYERGTRQAREGAQARARELLRRADNGDVYARDLLGAVTELAESGIFATLARLDVDFTHLYYESVGMRSARAAINAAVAAGLLTRRADGSIYASLGTETSPRELTFVRSDGSLLVYAQWLGVHVSYNRESPDVWRLNVAGVEWRDDIDTFAEIKRRLGYRTGDAVLYGMITVDGRKLGSRNGTSLTIDEELDRLLDRVRDDDQESADEFHEWLAVAALKLYVLSYPRLKELPYDPTRVLGFCRLIHRLLESTHPAQSLPTCSSHGADAHSSHAESPIYSLLLTLDTFPSVLSRATRLLDPSVIVRFLCELESMSSQAMRREPAVCVALHAMLRETVTVALSILGVEVTPETWQRSRHPRSAAPRDWALVTR